MRDTILKGEIDLNKNIPPRAWTENVFEPNYLFILVGVILILGIGFFVFRKIRK